MDPLCSGQDVLRCHICENPSPPLYCGICHLHLCKVCVGEHILDETTDHKVVPFNKRELATKCPKHSTKICELHCNECDISICATCASSEEHRGHAFVEIMKYFESQKEVIQKDLDELENVIFPKCQEIESSVPTQKDTLSKNSQMFTAAVIEQGEKMHKEIDFAIQTLKLYIGDFDSKNLAVLNKQEIEITLTISEITQKIDNMKQILNSNDFSNVSAYKSRNDEFKILPPKLPSSLPNFTPRNIDKEQIFQQFGFLSGLPINEKEHGYTMVVSKIMPPVPIKRLIDVPRIISYMLTDYGAPTGVQSVALLNDQYIWTCGYKDSYMKLYNIFGELVDVIQTSSGYPPYDIEVSKNGSLVYADYRERTVNIVNQEKSSQVQPAVIRLWGWKPRNICSTYSDDLLVLMDSDGRKESKVVRYCDCIETQNIQFDDEGDPLYSSGGEIKFVTENRNQDICVSDFNACEIVVVNQAGTLRFTYNGPPFITRRPFRPYGIATDSHGLILTADKQNDCINIIDQDGQFLRLIDNCELHTPWDLCVDSRDNLFVTESDTNKMKKIQYYIKTK
eukprot:GAHX01003273.1.p1 GENE.GAHX01003273.1~~GAHX01003273.1.p1  ORF type:complete len:565 (+),score=69.78 GAHX01003273.1:33-1727(+)